VAVADVVVCVMQLLISILLWLLKLWCKNIYYIAVDHIRILLFILALLLLLEAWLLLLISVLLWLLLISVLL
jgi:hypothetical protein